MTDPPRPRAAAGVHHLLAFTPRTPQLRWCNIIHIRPVCGVIVLRVWRRRITPSPSADVTIDGRLFMRRRAAAAPAPLPAPRLGQRLEDAGRRDRYLAQLRAQRPHGIVDRVGDRRRGPD